jgi:hypothetical protein
VCSAAAGTKLDANGRVEVHASSGEEGEAESKEEEKRKEVKTKSKRSL